jgi:hypothetical protein
MQEDRMTEDRTGNSKRRSQLAVHLSYTPSCRGETAPWEINGWRSLIERMAHFSKEVNSLALNFVFPVLLSSCLPVPCLPCSPCPALF